MLTVDVIHGDEAVSLDEALGTQAENCLALGSPLSHDVLLDLAGLAAPGQPLATMLAEHRSVRGGDLIGLRLLAAAHRMGLVCSHTGGVAPRTDPLRPHPYLLLPRPGRNQPVPPGGV